MAPADLSLDLRGRQNLLPNDDIRVQMTEPLFGEKLRRGRFPAPKASCESKYHGVIGPSDTETVSSSTAGCAGRPVRRDSGGDTLPAVFPDQRPEVLDPLQLGGEGSRSGDKAKEP